ncbi:MAG: hypothetical protein WCW35_15120 [Bacteroidota bacterium]
MKRSILALFLFTMFFSSVSLSQAKVGTDIYSRYVWRGVDYGNSTSLQPALTYVAGDLSVGVWGSYALAGGYSEADIWASYAVGPVTLYLTDYYIPAAPPALTFFNYSDNAGAHAVEVGVGYTGPEALPISLAAYYIALDGATVDNSVYVQASYPILSDLSLTVGGTPAKSAFYGTAKAGLINVGFTSSKTIKVSESLSIPFNVQYIMNPYVESAYLIFGISL